MTETASRSWGILGGTFDPLHYGHLALAENAREELDLTGVLFLPAGMPPHKPAGSAAAAADREAMVAAAIADNPAFRLCRVELERPGPSYAVDTAAELVRRPPVPDADPDGFVWLMSSEALRGLPDWREPQRLLDLVRVGVSPRPGYSTPDRAWLAEHFPGHAERFRFLDGPELSHSASRIRRLVGEGRSIRYLVPPVVEAYIHEHDLYEHAGRSAS